MKGAEIPPARAVIAKASPVTATGMPYYWFKLTERVGVIYVTPH
jgi:hypothetical protein